MKNCARRLIVMVALYGCVIVIGMSPLKISAASEPIERTISVNGMTRSYILHLPASYASRGQWPVIVAYHPGAATAQWMQDNARLHAQSASQNYIIAYPDGVRRTFNAGTCCGLALERKVDDVAFFKAIMNDIASIASIREKAYVTGFSNGAMMTFRLICDVPHMIAAAAPYAASIPVDQCVENAAVPVLYLNGGEDTLTLEGGERKTKSAFKSTSNTLINPIQALDQIARRNGCSAEKTPRQRPDIDATCDAYQQCPQGGDVEFCVINGVGHSWPGAPKPRPQDQSFLDKKLAERFSPQRPEINMSAAILEFFSQHP